MKIIPLIRSNRINSCNSYLILGNQNIGSNVVTVIDPGKDASILDEIKLITRDYGTTTVNQVILTHNQSNNAGGIQALRGLYNSKILAFKAGPDVDELIQDGQVVKAGDGILEVLHTPEHSPDSICLYAPSEKALFSGDMELMLLKPMTNDYVESLLKIACRDIQRIYSGHIVTIMSRGQDLILQTLERVRTLKQATDQQPLRH